MKYLWIFILISNSSLGQPVETISSLVEKLAHENDVIFPDDENKDYLLFREQATNQQLKTLVNHAAASVRVYAFLTLLERQSPKIESIFRQHLQDSVQLMDLTQGCVIYFCPTVSEYMLSNIIKQQYPLVQMSYEDYGKKLDTINGNIIYVEVPDIIIDPEDLEEDSPP